MRTVKHSGAHVRLVGILGAAILLVVLVFATSAVAAIPAKWEQTSTSNTSVAPGGTLEYTVGAKNIGGEQIDGEITMIANLPSGITAETAFVKMTYGNLGLLPCYDASDGGIGHLPVSGAQSVICKNTEDVPTYKVQMLVIKAKVDSSAAEGIHTASFTLSGGAPSVSTVDPVTVTNDTPVFGIDNFDFQPTANAGGAPSTQAGGHPYEAITPIDINTTTDPAPIRGRLWPVESVKDISAELPPGFVGNVASFDECAIGDLAGGEGGFTPRPSCPLNSQLGTVRVRFKGAASTVTSNLHYPLYNMAPPPGVAARFAFIILGTVVTLDAELRYADDYGLTVSSRNISQAISIAGTTVAFWGVPASEDHRLQRACPGEEAPEGGSAGINCTRGGPEVAFMRNPTSCTAPGTGFPVTLRIDSWADPGDFKEATVATHELPGYPATFSDWGPAAGVEACQDVPVRGVLDAQATSINTESSSGLEVHVEVPNPGFTGFNGIASSDIKAVKVALPEGMTINPSQAEGLGVCSPAQYASTELSFFPTPGKGCPDDAKIGSVLVKSPLLEETIPGDVYVAKPFDNPFGSLLALYVILHEPERGIQITLAGKVETNERTGQITTTFDDLPQLPFDSFDFKFREGARAPLVTPQSCGTYTTTAQFTGWSDPAHPITSTSDFQIIHGLGGGPCPSGGLPPFKPGLIAGSINNAAGHYSPFNVRLFRTDAEQEFTRFSIKLPPGISGKLAGVPFCSEAAIAAAKTRTGAEELASPSCPAASEVGHTLAGAGVGSVLTYAPGKIYLAGPYNGSALSIAAITAAKVGPFDLGTVVVRQALKVDPETAEVFIDATGSDPIPHIIDGITVHLRDIRAYVDKPEFTLNPTSCERTSTASTVLGSGLDFASDIDDRPVTVSTPYQAASCASLGFKPQLSLKLKGGTRRAGHPALKATLKMKPGMANIARAQVTLPKSEFLDQSHIGTVCTRVQYAKDQCPPKSVYGYARAFTPILDEPLQGPVYLRSSSHKLPDLVAGLKSGKIEIDLAGRIDSVDGQIRSTFETVPDAPVSKFILTMQGGKKGLLENSTNLCAKAHKAIVEFDGQNGKISDSTPVVKPRCKKAERKKAAHQKRADH